MAGDGRSMATARWGGFVSFVTIWRKSNGEAKLGGFVLAMARLRLEISNKSSGRCDKMTWVLSVLSNSERPQMDTDETQIGLQLAAKPGAPWADVKPQVRAGQGRRRPAWTMLRIGVEGRIFKERIPARRDGRSNVNVY